MKQLLYNPWILAVGSYLLSAFIIWCLKYFYTNYIIRKKKRNTYVSQQDTIEHVMPLVLVVDKESRENINFQKLSNIVKAVYREKGYEASLLSYSRITGRIEIKNGRKVDMISQLIGKLVLEFNIKHIEVKT